MKEQIEKGKLKHQANNLEKKERSLVQDLINKTKSKQKL